MVKPSKSANFSRVAPELLLLYVSSAFMTLNDTPIFSATSFCVISISILPFIILYKY